MSTICAALGPHQRYDTSVSIRERLKQRAVELGFDLVGIAPAVPGRDLEFVREWLGRGYAGEMAYLSNPKRLDPKLVLPSLQSVVCVGLIYDTALPYSTEVGSKRKAGGRRQEAEGRKEQESEVRSQEPGARTGAPVVSGQLSVDETRGPGPTGDDGFGADETPPSGFQPSPSGRGCPDLSGAGEGVHFRFSNFEFRVSNFQFPDSGDVGGQDARAPRGWISRYAWGRDYHGIMREKLEKLRAEIERLASGAETRVYVDTGPVSERAFARFSGLGWMGKNTCIINEEKGSWFFLGVILTSLALDPDLPAPDRCGTCRACLDACPTGALVEPYVMDATRCISYLTIELKGSIPQDLRTGMGSNIFGCDICQDVCPWNGKYRSQKQEIRSQERAFEPMAVSCRPSAISHQQTEVASGRWAVGKEKRDNFQSSIFIFQSPSPSPEPPAPSPRSSVQNPKSKIQNLPSPQPSAPSTLSLFAPSLEALAAMTGDDFLRTFRHSPIRRAKYRGWLRNLAVAMGNTGDARFIPRLQVLATSPDPLVREHAAWALARLGAAPH